MTSFWNRLAIGGINRATAPYSVALPLERGYKKYYSNARWDSDTAFHYFHNKIYKEWRVSILKKLYKIASLLFAWGLLMNTAAFATNDVPTTVSNNMDASSDTPVAPDNLSQLPALGAYNALYSTFEMDETGDYIFPDEYGGEYINDNDQLVVLLVNRTEASENNYLSRCGENANNIVQFQDAEYSLNDLISIQNDMRSSYAELSVELTSIDCEENQIDVYVSEESSLATRNSAQARTAGSSIYFSDAVNIVITHNNLCENSYAAPAAYELAADTRATNAYGGWFLKSSSGTFTAGFCGTYSGKPAVVSCGHGATKNGTVSRINAYGTTLDSSFGTVSKQQYSNSAYGDYSIITLAGYSATNKITYNGTTYSITGNQYSAPKGTRIYKIGYSTGLTSGTIESNYSDIGSSGESYSGMYIYGIIRTSVSSASGDSGGPVFLAYSSGYGALGTVAATTASGEMMYSALRYAINAGFSLKTS